MTSGSHDTDRQERLQRIRIAATGLAAVFFVVLTAGALRNSASDEKPAPEAAGIEVPNGLPDIVGANIAQEPLPQEPLVELGVTPSTTANSSATNSAVAEPGKDKGP